MKKKLSPAKRALLEKWLKGQQLTNDAPGIPRRPQNSPIKISFSQQRQLFLELLDRGTAVNHLSIFLQLKGKLNLVALTKSTNQIMERHEVLRTRFSFDMGIPSPEILNDIKIAIPIVDLMGFDGKDREIEARRLAEKEVLQPFDLATAPLIRLKLYKLENDNYLLLIIAHHTIADGWSLGVFLKELMHFYQANTSAKPIRLPELPIQYYDYAYWQTDKKRQEHLQSSKSYWKKQLSDELAILELPTDQARDSKQSFTGETHRFLISEKQTKALEEVGRQEDATLFMTLLTAFYLMLHRFSGQDDILVGTPIANRNLPELENLIGIFINTLVLRVSLSGDPSFRELLRQVRKVSLDAYTHQDFPFEKLLEELKPKRDLNRPPLFQVVFNLQNSPLPKLEIPALETAFREIDRGVAQFELTLMLSKVEDQCHATVEYNANLFKPSTISRMFNSFQLFLDYALSQPDKPISKIQLVSKEEFQHIVYELNQTQLNFPREKCVHQLIEEQVENIPNAIAVVDEQHQITYGELNRRANVLAKYLKELIPDAKIRVGILMKKSLEIVETLLGVLKAGGAYVPIHIASPPDRIQFILKDAKIQVLITNIDHEPLDEFKGAIVNLNEENLFTKDDCLNPATHISSNSLAYIIYTSGSTGHPKGVMINHSTLMNFFWSMRSNPGMDKDSVILALTSISFDPSTLELFLPLIVGAKIVMGSEKIATNPLLLIETINRYNINILQATPATWQLLLQTDWKGKSDLKALCGGDVLTRELANQLLGSVGSLWNMYGPTEATVWATICQIQKEDAPITIGRPIGNVQTYILDQYLQPVPIGVIGELHIGGECLAVAYLNKPELTHEKFIPNPFSSKSDDRLYKTGDLVRYLSDYRMEILGRSDDQVKVNGHRMELGEITNVLKQHPSVKDGVVTIRAKDTEDKRLVAYFVPKHYHAPKANELREFFEKKLPAYMIPTYYVSIDSIPLSPSKKIDRKSLPIPEDMCQFSSYVAPRNKEEQIMVEIWQNVLNIQQIGIHDNFFDLGGASIQSIQIVARANMYGYRISVENIFEYQTIAELTNCQRAEK